MRAIGILIIIIVSCKCFAQNQTDTTFKPYGIIGGMFFGDYAYKLKADSLKRGNLEYSGLAKDQSLFNIRRAYLSYLYYLSDKFSTEFVLAYESPSPLTSNRNIFIKYLNLRWKNIFNGSDLLIGQVRTPTYALIENLWSYRSVEKTSSNLRQLGSYSDLGIALQGTFNKKGSLSYTVMVANGSGLMPENDKYKKLYTSLVAKCANDKLIFELNANFEEIAPALHRSRLTFKAGAVYQIKKITFGIEAFDDELNHYSNAITVTGRDTAFQNLNEKALGISFFIRNNLTPKLSSFIRYDRYNPDSHYDPNLKYLPLYNTNNESFFTAGLDFHPIEKVHFIPNIWYNHYHNKNKSFSDIVDGCDLVARLTVYVIFK